MPSVICSTRYDRKSAQKITMATSTMICIESSDDVGHFGSLWLVYTPDKTVFSRLDPSLPREHMRGRSWDS